MPEIGIMTESMIETMVEDVIEIETGIEKEAGIDIA